MQLRIDNGYNIHRLVPGRPLILSCQNLEQPAGLGLDGHSHTDELLHPTTVIFSELNSCTRLANIFPQSIRSEKGPKAKRDL